MPRRHATSQAGQGESELLPPSPPPAVISGTRPRETNSCRGFLEEYPTPLELVPFGSWRGKLEEVQVGRRWEKRGLELMSLMDWGARASNWA